MLNPILNMDLMIKLVAVRGLQVKWDFKDISKTAVLNLITIVGLELEDYISSQEAENIFMKNADGILADLCSDVALSIIVQVS